MQANVIEMVRPQKFYLWWLDSRTNRRLPAGVAFYDEKFGEYRLKIDFFQALQDQSEQQFYLKAVGASGDDLLFRVEVVLKRNGKFAGRYPVGEGRCGKDTGDEIYIEFGPFEKTLVLTLGAND